MKNLKKALNVGYDRIMRQEETQKVAALFEQRPIWSRYALMRKSGISTANLKKILPYIAFYWGTGPWARMWNRWGFDPRQEKVLARKLQTVDVRVTSMEMIAAKRKTTSKLAYNMVQKLTLIEQADHSMRMFDEKAKNEIEVDEILDINSQIHNERVDNYEYHPGLLPPRRQMFYQLIDVKLPQVQELLNDHEPCYHICTKVSAKKNSKHFKISGRWMAQAEPVEEYSSNYWTGYSENRREYKSQNG